MLRGSLRASLRFDAFVYEVKESDIVYSVPAVRHGDRNFRDTLFARVVSGQHIDRVEEVQTSLLKRSKLLGEKRFELAHGVATRAGSGDQADMYGPGDKVWVQQTSHYHVDTTGIYNIERGVSCTAPLSDFAWRPDFEMCIREKGVPVTKVITVVGAATTTRTPTFMGRSPTIVQHLGCPETARLVFNHYPQDHLDDLGLKPSRRDAVWGMSMMVQAPEWVKFQQRRPYDVAKVPLRLPGMPRKIFPDGRVEYLTPPGSVEEGSVSPDGFDDHMADTEGMDVDDNPAGSNSGSNTNAVVRAQSRRAVAQNGYLRPESDPDGIAPGEHDGTEMGAGSHPPTLPRSRSYPDTPRFGLDDADLFGAPTPPDQPDEMDSGSVRMDPSANYGTGSYWSPFMGYETAVCMSPAATGSGWREE
jgi:hypothetical protein